MRIKYANEQQAVELTLACNTGEGGLFSNVSANLAKGLPTIALHQKAIVVGGGPSLADTLVIIQKLKAEGGKIYALNNAAKFLSEHGIRADAQIILDPRIENLSFIEKPWTDELLLCSQAHPAMADRCKEIGYPVRLWHPSVEGIAKYLPKDSQVVAASLTVGLSSLCLLHGFGHREFHLFGYDSSMKGDSTHAYQQWLDKENDIVRCAADNQVFYAPMAMAGQANQFKEVHDMLVANGSRVTVYGTGFLPTLWAAWKREEAQRVLTAVYDLGTSPPTYDFLSFLMESERHRKAAGYTDLDIVFQPGPIHGFRDDDLPPDAETRRRMLWNVCVAMAKLLPSVRNIEVKRQRGNVAGDVFPVGWRQDAPVSHYGTAYLKNGFPALKASEDARKRVRLELDRMGIYGFGRYATISLRQAPYWAARNSNLDEWLQVAQWLTQHGIMAVFIPDTETPDIPNASREAMHDLDYRAALYEGAVINLGVLNGPMSLCAFLDCKYLIFKVGGGDEKVAGSTEFLNAHGITEEQGFGGQGRLIWKPDMAANIINELNFLEKTS